MGKGLESTFLQRRYTSGPQAREKMVSITDRQGNANRDHDETLPNRVATVKTENSRCGRRRAKSALWTYNGAATVENSLEAPHKIKHRISM